MDAFLKGGMDLSLYFAPVIFLLNLYFAYCENLETIHNTRNTGVIAESIDILI